MLIDFIPFLKLYKIRPFLRERREGDSLITAFTRGVMHYSSERSSLSLFLDCTRNKISCISAAIF